MDNRPYQFFNTRVVIRAAMTMMRDTVMVIIWWTARPVKKNQKRVAIGSRRDPGEQWAKTPPATKLLSRTLELHPWHIFAVPGGRGRASNRQGFNSTLGLPGWHQDSNTEMVDIVAAPKNDSVTLYLAVCPRMSLPLPCYPRHTQKAPISDSTKLTAWEDLYTF